MAGGRPATSANKSRTRGKCSRPFLIATAMLFVGFFLAIQKSAWVSWDRSGKSAHSLSLMSTWPFTKKMSFRGVGGSIPRNMTTKGITLTKREIQKIAPDGILLATMANRHYLDFVVSWVHNLQQIPVSSYIIGALDDTLDEELKNLKINTFHLGSMTASVAGWGTTTFLKMGSMKVRAILFFQEMGVNVIFTDIDAMWLRNPIPYWKTHWRADMLMSSDQVEETHVDGGLDDPLRISIANIGILMLKPSAKEFTKKWLNLVLSDEDYWDQNAFNDLLPRDRTSSINDPDRLFRDTNGTMLLGYLPVALFCSGHTYFVQHMYKKWDLHPYAAHATYQYGGTQGKRHRLREALLWHDPPEYFDAPNGFIAYKPDIPNDLLANAVPKHPTKIWLNDTLGHFALVNHQLTQVRNALSIAYALNRTLIFPEMWCGHERHMFPHPGRVGLAKTKLPYLCPLDHIFNLGQMLPSDKAPFIDIREYSFLRNKRLPDSVRKTALRVNMCHGKKCDVVTDWDDFTIDGNPAADHLQLQPGLTDAGLRAALGDVSKYKILHFSSMVGSFGGFENEAAAEAFEQGTWDYTDIWCCVHGNGTGGAGHVHYDLYHDIIPHTDKFGRKFTKSWFPIKGP